MAFLWFLAWVFGAVALVALPFGARFVYRYTSAHFPTGEGMGSLARSVRGWSIRLFPALVSVLGYWAFTLALEKLYPEAYARYHASPLYGLAFLLLPVVAFLFWKGTGGFGTLWGIIISLMAIVFAWNTFSPPASLEKKASLTPSVQTAGCTDRTFRVPPGEWSEEIVNCKSAASFAAPSMSDADTCYGVMQDQTVFILCPTGKKPAQLPKEIEQAEVRQNFIEGGAGSFYFMSLDDRAHEMQVAYR